MADNKVIITSEKGKIDNRDIGKGTILAIVTTVMVGIQEAGNAFFEQIFPILKTINPTAKTIVMAGIGAGLGYLIQKLREEQKMIIETKDADVQARVVSATTDPMQTSTVEISSTDSSNTKE